MSKKLSKFKNKKLIWAVVLIILGGAYYQFGTVATVNNRLISRFKYIKNMESQVGKQTLEQMVVESLIMTEAKKEGVEITQAEIDTEIEAIGEQIKAQGQTLESALAMEGMKLSDLEKQIKTQKMLEKMAGADTEVSQEDIDTFLEEYKDQLPEDMGEEELQDLAKSQLEGQAKSGMIDEWLETLKEEANIYYR